MSANKVLVVSLNERHKCLEEVVGGKGAKLSRLIAEGFRVPEGFCLTVNAYRFFIEKTKIDTEIKMELGRKPLENMRWEELWDAALRIRSLFLRYDIPEIVVDSVRRGYNSMRSPNSLAVRSSALGEDSSGLSFAGLHESITNVTDFNDLIKSIRIIWASLWSDAALLYRKEMGLDPDKSAMAIVIQKFLSGGPSGVAFSKDPRNVMTNQAIIEAVPGVNSELVDGIIEPDRWIIDRSSREIIESYQAERNAGKTSEPLLSIEELMHLYNKILSVESIFGWAADVEWTGRAENLSILQARPITFRNKQDTDDQRGWYLTLRPNLLHLKKLANRVNEELLPLLVQEGELLAQQVVRDLNDRKLAEVIKERWAMVKKWRKIYYDEFIPLAHGVRQLGIYYNNEVKPDDPYEFLALLEGQDLMAARRNKGLNELAKLVIEDEQLAKILKHLMKNADLEHAIDWNETVKEIQNAPKGGEFANLFGDISRDYAHVSFKGDNLSDHPEIYLHTVLEIAEAQLKGNQRPLPSTDTKPHPHILKNRLLGAVGKSRHSEALEMIELGRLSWRLRDDDNILVGRLESLLLEALDIAGKRLFERGLLDKYERFRDTSALILANALLDPPEASIELPEEKPVEISKQSGKIAKPRQLVGQPASPGFASGSARLIRDSSDLGRFKFGEVLICDAIQPTMTHVVPLASAIVERRGGMLIHGAIIARELGIPCVNGVAGAANLIKEGELITVDGYLGIVTIGEAELRLEKAYRDDISH